MLYFNISSKTIEKIRISKKYQKVTHTSALVFFLREVEGPGEFDAGASMTICPVIDDKELLV